MFFVTFSPLAQQDLLEIHSYVSSSLHNPIAARHLIQSIKEAVFSLRSFPERGSSLKQDGRTTLYRYLICKNYLIFYHIDCTDVKIDRILYGRRDYLSSLFNELMHKSDDMQ